MIETADNHAMFINNERNASMSYKETLEAALTLKNALKEIDALVEKQIAAALDAEGSKLEKAA